MIYRLVLILLILSGTILLALSMIALRRRSSELASAFALVSLCAAIWNFGFAAEVISPTLESKIFWANAQFFGIAFLPLGWLAMTMIATGQSRKNLRAIPFLAIIPVLTLLVTWSNPYHIFRQNPTLNQIGVPFPVLVNDYGVYFYAVHAPYNYLLLIAALYLLVRYWRQGSSIHRRQRFIMLISLVLPLVVDTLYVLGITPIPAFNLASTFFTFSALLMGFNVVQLQFLDILPLAYEVAITEMDVGVIVLDRQGKVLHLNPAAEKITAVTRMQAIGRGVGEIFPLLLPLWEAKDQRCELTLKQGEDECVYQVSCSEIKQSRNQLAGHVITLVDVSEQAKLHQQLERISITDPLTGALNRRALTRYGEQEIQRAHRYQYSLSLMMLDVDNFKQINDEYGHQWGDAVLKAMVHTIRQTIRASDHIFRYGGDEFVILLLETEPSGALRTANRIQDAMAQLTVTELATSVRLQISIGITSLSNDDDLESMLQRADRALYQAKAAGKAQSVVL